MNTIGSRIAKDGFANEADVCSKFNEWKTDVDAQEWLTIMQYDLTKIEYVKAVQVSGYKTDVQVQVTIKIKDIIDAQNLQVKLVSNPNGFNQIDKRWVDTYGKMWNLPDSVTTTLKHYTGELEPTTITRDPRRMFFDEMDVDATNEVLKWFDENKYLVVSDIMKGRGHLAAEWILVALKLPDDVRWTLKPINVAMNHFSSGAVYATPSGNVKIGRITMQRKGGDGGKDTAKMLQFKLNPVELFDVN